MDKTDDVKTSDPKTGIQVGTIFHTGQTVLVHGVYFWVGYCEGAGYPHKDGASLPRPTREEMDLNLKVGDRFTAIASVGEAAYWRLGILLDDPETLLGSG